MANKTKTHLVFSEELLKTIDRLVGKRKRSKFFVEATERELKRIKLLKAIEEAAGTWKDKDHPELVKKGTYRWVRKLRREDERGLRKVRK